MAGHVNGQGQIQSGKVPESKAESSAPSPVSEADEESTRSRRQSDASSPEYDGDLRDNSKIPKLSYAKLFWFIFYNFGFFAWGGPVAQIALIKDKLVIQDQWISLPRFQRVFSAYQILPGPEAAELCMFFGCLSAGRIGGIIAGIAFILPGFVLMLLAISIPWRALRISISMLPSELYSP
jgi:hypothetical protein